MVRQALYGYISGANASDYGLVSQSTPQTYNVILPSTAKYVRASWYKTTYDAPVDIQISYKKAVTQPGEYLSELLAEKVDIDQGSANSGKSLIVGADGDVTLSTITLESLKDAQDDLQDELDDFIGTPGSTINADVTVVDGYMMLDTGSPTATASWECSDYIDVSDSGNHVVMLHSTVYGYGSTVWYDSSKNKIGAMNGNNASDYGITASEYWQTYQLTLPSNAKYVRTSGYKTRKTDSDALSASYTTTPTPGTIDTLLADKIDVDQGSGNAGKVLTVGNDGNVAPVSSPWATDLATKADKSDVDVIESIVGDPEYMNLVDPTEIATSTFINGSTGARAESAYFKSSDFLLLKANTLYYVGNFYTNSSNPTQYCAFYSSPSESDFLSEPDVTLTRSADDHCTILVGDNDVYARLSALATGTNLYVSSYVDYYVAYAGPITLKEMVTPKCRFRKVLVLGDSISTDAYGDYKKWVSDLVDDGFFPADVVNSSQHATGFVARYNSQPNDFISRLTGIQNPETYDLVITFGGINDANQLVPMGETTDTDYTTYFGAAVRYYYKYLCTNFINARIATLLPLPCSTQNRDPSVIGVQYTYSAYQKSVCESYSLPVLDLTNHSGFYPDANKPGIDYYAAQAFRNRWTLKVGDYDPDGIHPTAEYEKNYLAPMIKAFIETL